MTSSIEHENSAMDTMQVELQGDGKNDSSKHSTSGNVKLVNTIGEVRRDPTASDDPNDPLNFSKWIKLGISVCCCWFSIFSLVLVGGLGPLLGSFITLYAPQGQSVQQVVSLIIYPSVVVALAFSFFHCP
ncbi:hypothetical protein AAFC00_000256 [Neodothiora populina]|uniref:Uncharacterized protein n=1 Tax=Neodothiora populina TaxID=2781224 RepID=A0ABR3P393_9PEZI